MHVNETLEGTEVTFSAANKDGLGGSFFIVSVTRKFFVTHEENKCVARIVDSHDEQGAHIGFMDEDTERDLGDASRGYTNSCVASVKQACLKEGEEFVLVQWGEKYPPDETVTPMVGNAIANSYGHGGAYRG